MLAAVQEQVRTLDKFKLRSMAANFVSDFMSYLVGLLQGSLGGNPVLNGQTLFEEKNHCGDWLDIDGKAIVFDAAEWGVPEQDAKLYGGQQCERLLAEFRIVSEHMQLRVLSLSEIATAAGLDGLKNVSGQIAAASELAQRESRATFEPLLRQLYARMEYVIKRVPFIVENVMETRSLSRSNMQKSESVAVMSLKNHPQFMWYLQRLFEEYVEELSRSAYNKCFDELMATQLVIWQLDAKR
jgi:hypothetical protein